MSYPAVRHSGYFLSNILVDDSIVVILDSIPHQVLAYVIARIVLIFKACPLGAMEGYNPVNVVGFPTNHSDLPSCKGVHAHITSF